VVAQGVFCVLRRLLALKRSEREAESAPKPLVTKLQLVTHPSSKLCFANLRRAKAPPDSTEFPVLHPKPR